MFVSFKFITLGNTPPNIQTMNAGDINRIISHFCLSWNTVLYQNFYVFFFKIFYEFLKFALKMLFPNNLNKTLNRKDIKVYSLYNPAGNSLKFLGY